MNARGLGPGRFRFPSPNFLGERLKVCDAAPPAPLHWSLDKWQGYPGLALGNSAVWDRVTAFASPRISRAWLDRAKARIRENLSE
ncbi:MAG: hypothetical protein ACI8YI_000080 [Paracoccaceae bacterium]|jgi:hypothetical protein